MEQFERAQRYLERLRAAYAGIDTGSRSKRDCEDDTLSFFMHCYHIRDWIVHLNKLGIGSREVDAFINGNECLKICADLCNGTKHCVLTHATRTGWQPHIAGKQYRSSVWLTGTGGEEVLHGKYWIMTSSGMVDALALAEECMQCWSDFTAQMQHRYAQGAATPES